MRDSGLRLSQKSTGLLGQPELCLICVPYHGTQIFASLSAHIAAQGLAGHLVQFEAGFAPSSSPCIMVFAMHRFKFFDKLKRLFCG